MVTGNAIDINAQAVLDSLNEGIYVVDRNRTILYWGDSSERITGWTAGDVLGRSCSDDLLCHQDKDGHKLCGEEYCPLHRAMMTGESSTSPIVLFAQGKDGNRVPLQVSVGPVRDAAGNIIGGVETFRDLSSEIHDLERVKRIQSVSLGNDLPDDPRVRFRTHYIPCDIIGGDYYAVKRIDDNCYGFLLADVSGHGPPAALYTMCLSSLWLANQSLITTPSAFARRMSGELNHLVAEEVAFAAAVCGVVDLKKETLRFAGAGNPAPILARADGQWEILDSSGLPFGLMSGADYDETCLDIGSGDCLLLFTDGAVEVRGAAGRQLNTDGLVKILKALDYPRPDVRFDAIEEEMLKYSNGIRFDDDLTFLEMRLN